MTMNAASSSLIVPDILRPLRWEEVFGPERGGQPVALDLGAGDGGFALAYARQRPELNVLAVERLMGRARKIARRGQRQELRNLRALRLESGYVVERLCAPASVDEIHLLFPDPWPKRRHWERRIVQPAFLAAAARALKPQGLFRLVTDHADYFAHSLDVFAAAPFFARGPDSAVGSYPMTDFETGFRAEGKEVHQGNWIRV